MLRHQIIAHVYGFCGGDGKIAKRRVYAFSSLSISRINRNLGVVGHPIYLEKLK